METFIRFQTRLRCGETGRPAGIFVAAGRVEDRGNVPALTRERLKDVLGWFNRNLAVPKIEDRDWRCLFWFRPESPVIHQIWELTWLLEEEGVFVSKVRTRNPGRIVYRDEHQVAAVPEQKKNRSHR